MVVVGEGGGRLVVDLWLPDGPLLIEVGGRGRGAGGGLVTVAAPRPRVPALLIGHGVTSLVTVSRPSSRCPPVAPGRAAVLSTS